MSTSARKKAMRDGLKRDFPLVMAWAQLSPESERMARDGCERSMERAAACYGAIAHSLRMEQEGMK